MVLAMLSGSSCTLIKKSRIGAVVAMSIPTDHHFLPKFLLDAWCGDDGKLVAYSKPHGNTVAAKRYAPKAVAKQQELYSLELLPPADAQVIESGFLQLVDDHAARAFQTVYAKGADTITPQERSDITLFLLSLRVRHPDAVNMLRVQGTAELIAELDRDPGEAIEVGLPPGTKLSEYVAEKHPVVMRNWGLSLLPSIAHNQKYLDRLARLQWSDVRFPADYPDLIIGDRACLLRGDLLSTCIMILPLGPRRAVFVASNRESIEKLRRQNQRQLVKRINRWSAESAIDYFYAARDGHEPLARARLRERKEREEKPCVAATPTSFPVRKSSTSIG